MKQKKSKKTTRTTQRLREKDDQVKDSDAQKYISTQIILPLTQEGRQIPCFRKRKLNSKHETNKAKVAICEGTSISENIQCSLNTENQNVDEISPSERNHNFQVGDFSNVFDAADSPVTYSKQSPIKTGTTFSTSQPSVYSPVNVAEHCSPNYSPASLEQHISPSPSKHCDNLINSQTILSGQRPNTPDSVKPLDVSGSATKIIKGSQNNKLHEAELCITPDNRSKLDLQPGKSERVLSDNFKNCLVSPTIKCNTDSIESNTVECHFSPVTCNEITNEKNNQSTPELHKVNLELDKEIQPVQQTDPVLSTEDKPAEGNGIQSKEKSRHDSVPSQQNKHTDRDVQSTAAAETLSAECLSLNKSLPDIAWTQTMSHLTSDDNLELPESKKIKFSYFEDSQDVTDSQLQLVSESADKQIENIFRETTFTTKNEFTETRDNVYSIKPRSQKDATLYIKSMIKELKALNNKLENAEEEINKCLESSFYIRSPCSKK